MDNGFTQIVDLDKFPTEREVTLPIKIDVRCLHGVYQTLCPFCSDPNDPGLDQIIRDLQASGREYMLLGQETRVAEARKNKPSTFERVIDLGD